MIIIEEVEKRGMFWGKLLYWVDCVKEVGEFLNNNNNNNNNFCSCINWCEKNVRYLNYYYFHSITSISLNLFLYLFLYRF